MTGKKIAILIYYQERGNIYNFFENQIELLQKQEFIVHVCCKKILSVNSRVMLENKGCIVYVTEKNCSNFDAWNYVLKANDYFAGHDIEMLLLEEACFGPVQYRIYEDALSESDVVILSTKSIDTTLKKRGILLSSRICKDDSLFSLRDVTNISLESLSENFSQKGFVVSDKIWQDNIFNISDFNYSFFTDAANNNWKIIFESCGEEKDKYKKLLFDYLRAEYSPLILSHIMKTSFLIKNDTTISNAYDHALFVWVDSLEKINSVNSYVSQITTIKTFYIIPDVNNFENISVTNDVIYEQCSTLFEFFHYHENEMREYDFVCLVNLLDNKDYDEECGEEYDEECDGYIKQIGYLLDQLLVNDSYIQDVERVLASNDTLGILQSMYGIGDEQFCDYLSSFYVYQEEMLEWKQRFDIWYSNEEKISNLNNRGCWINMRKFPYEYFEDEYLCEAPSKKLADAQWKALPYLFQKKGFCLGVIENYDYMEKRYWDQQKCVDEIILKTRNNKNKLSHTYEDFLRNIKKQVKQVKQETVYNVETIPISLKENFYFTMKKHWNYLTHKITGR